VSQWKYQTEVVILKEEQKLKGVESRELRRIFRTKKEIGLIGAKGKLYNQELHNL
jgi:hypothetical protein